MIRRAYVTVSLGLGALAACTGEHVDLQRVVANDNRTPAGTLSNDTLRIRLVVRMADWRPEADSGPNAHLAAFAEEGSPPAIPGPLIRVRTGTIISATIRNELPDSTLYIHGFERRPAAASDSFALRPGESRQVVFSAGAPGTYFYHAVTGKHVYEVDEEREQLSGALIVDPAEGSPPDRIMVINIWARILDSVTYRNALAINGRSWPYTERLNPSVGDTLRWRVINPTERPHPMHLHGFYFTVNARGDGRADTLYAPAARRLAVTESLLPFTTMDMTWVPERPGNWLFHCHIGFHVVPGTRLEPPPPDNHDRMAHDPRLHMAGLVMGIAVHPRPGVVDPARGTAREVRLFVQEGARRGRAARAMGFVLQRGSTAPEPDSVEIPGSPLVLTRGEPTDIVVINRLRETAAIHWHGIELESFSDGVAGWSGTGTNLAPSIQPGDSFVARLTLPRAGTFMYHTHMNDIEQLTSGLYGGIVVLEPGHRFDPSRDHLFVAGWDGDADPPHLLVNGDSMPRPFTLSAGIPHRFRFINIGAASRFVFAVYRDSSLMQWRALAKDGAELPPAQATARLAKQRIDVGETYDYEFTPGRGEYRLVVGDPAKPTWTQRLIVR